MDNTKEKKKMGCGGCFLRVFGISFLLVIICGLFGLGNEDSDNSDENSSTVTTTVDDTVAIITTSSATTTATTTTITTTTTTNDITMLETTINNAEIACKADVLLACIDSILPQIDSAVEFYYYDNDGNIIKDVIGDDYYMYDPSFPYYIEGWSCYTEDVFYCIPLYYYTGTNCRTFKVDINTFELYSEEEYEETQENDTDWLAEIDGYVELAVRNRVFSDNWDGREVDVYFDGIEIGKVKASGFLNTQEENFEINTTAGTHYIEFISTGLFKESLYSKYRLDILDVSVYLDVTLRDSDYNFIEAEFEHRYDDYMLTDGMYYVEPVYIDDEVNDFSTDVEDNNTDDLTNTDENGYYVFKTTLNGYSGQTIATDFISAFCPSDWTVLPLNNIWTLDEDAEGVDPYSLKFYKGEYIKNESDSFLLNSIEIEYWEDFGYYMTEAFNKENYIELELDERIWAGWCGSLVNDDILEKSIYIFDLHSENDSLSICVVGDLNGSTTYTDDDVQTIIHSI